MSARSMEWRRARRSTSEKRLRQESLPPPRQGEAFLSEATHTWSGALVVSADVVRAGDVDGRPGGVPRPAGGQEDDDLGHVPWWGDLPQGKAVEAVLVVSEVGADPGADPSGCQLSPA